MVPAEKAGDDAQRGDDGSDHDRIGGADTINLSLDSLAGG